MTFLHILIVVYFLVLFFGSLPYLNPCLIGYNILYHNKEPIYAVSDKGTIKKKYDLIYL